MMPSKQTDEVRQVMGERWENGGMFYSSRVQMAESLHQDNGGVRAICARRSETIPHFPIFPPALVTAAIGGQSMRRKEAK